MVDLVGSVLRGLSKGLVDGLGGGVVLGTVSNPNNSLVAVGGSQICLDSTGSLFMYSTGSTWISLASGAA